MVVVAAVTFAVILIILPIVVPVPEAAVINLPPPNDIGNALAPFCKVRIAVDAFDPKLDRSAFAVPFNVVDPERVSVVALEPMTVRAVLRLELKFIEPGLVAALKETLVPGVGFALN